MGRQPDTSPPTKQPDSTGILSPEVWVKVVLSKHLQAATGTLTMRSGEDCRVFRFVGGMPTVVRSSLDNEEFTETMVGAGIIEQARLDWIRKHTGAEESEIEALIGAGTIDRAEVDAHHALHVQHLLGAGLGWTEGSHSWEPQPNIRERFESSLLPKINVIEGLIGGVFGAFDLGALRTYIDASNAGEFLPDPQLANNENNHCIPTDMKGLHQLLGQNHGRIELAESLGCDADRLAAMLWIMEAAGWAKRSAPPAALIPMGTVATIRSGRSTTGPEPSASRPKAGPSKAMPAAIVAPKSLPKAEPAEASEPAPKTAVKKKVAPKASPTTKPPIVDSAAVLKKAINALESNDFDGAYTLLIDARKQRPSCPDTLAALGWTAWRTGNLGTNAYDGPEDFLLLALTFDAKHPKALEYYARIAIDKGETENARNRLLQVLQVTPDASWAKDALEASGTARKGGIRLWPKSNQ